MSSFWSQVFHPTCLPGHTVVPLTSFLFFQIWFKNQRAKNKKTNLWKTHQVLPESNGSSEDVSVSTPSHRHLSVPALANIEHTTLDTSTVDYILPPILSLQASLHDDQAIEDTRSNPQEDLFERHAPVVAHNPGQPTVVESQLYPAVAEWAASMEAPISTTEGNMEQTMFNLISNF